MPPAAAKISVPHDPEAAYDLMRAREERERALGSANIWARAAHHEMAVAYEQRVWRRDPQLLTSLRVRD